MHANLDELLKAYNLLSQAVGIFALEGDCICVNSAWENKIGLVNHLHSFVHAEHIQTLMHDIYQQQDDQQSTEKELQLYVQNIEYSWFSIHFIKFFNEALSQHVLIITAFDIQDQKTSYTDIVEQLDTYKNMLDASVDSIVVTDIDGCIRQINTTAYRVFGLEKNLDVTGKQWIDLLPVDIRGRAKKALDQAVQGCNARFSVKNILADEIEYWDTILTPILDKEGQTPIIVCASRNVTQQKKSENNYRKNSELDDLTGLYNRRLFKIRLKRMLANAKEKQHIAGVMLLDLDHFKHVNDTLGHSAGDHLLKVLSKRLMAVLGEDAFVARLGGDEFAIAVGKLTSVEAFNQIAKLVLQQIESPISYAGKYINGGMSIGCALYPKDANDSIILIQNADTALNDLKADGRGGIRYFNQQMFIETENIATQLNLARKIVRMDLITPYYQAKIDLTSGQLVGLEALLRWISPSQGLMFPVAVAEAFKDYQLASQISERMHHKIFKDISNWLVQGYQVPRIAINAAPVEFLRDDYAEQLLARMECFNTPYELIEIEVTEQMLEERGADYVLRALELLKQKGIKISLDDFGTGHSSLIRLKDYPVDCLKIDRSFTQLIGTDATILALVQVINDLGPKLALDIVAEGIETQDQLDILLESGCKIGQGFLFGKAESKDVTTKRLKKTMRLC